MSMHSAPPSCTPAPRIAAGLLNGMAAGALWGLIFLLPLLLPAFNGWQLAAARYLVYGALALLLLLPRWHKAMRGMGTREWLALMGLSMLGNILYYVLLAFSVQRVGAAPAALVLGLIPVVVTLAGSRQQGALPMRALAPPLALCLLGAALVALESLMAAAPGGSGAAAASGPWQRALGLLAAAGALLSWSAYSIWNSHWLLRRPDISPWDWSLLTGLSTGALALLLAVPAFGPGLLGSASAHGAGDWLRFWLLTSALAILASIVGNGFWNRASRLLPLTMIGQMIVFETVFALLYGFVHAWRLPRALEWLAALALIGGVLWCTRLHQGRPGRP